MTEPNYPESVLTPEELKAGRDRIAIDNTSNIVFKRPNTKELVWVKFSQSLAYMPFTSVIISSQ
jgi:hypothetical protein